MSIFSSVPLTKLSRSTFNLDHENKLSFDFGGLYPILCQTILPGDRASLAVQNFVRTVPLLSPVMHRNDIKIDSFFVPFRLIWSSYEKFLQCTDSTIKMPQVSFPDDESISVNTYNALFGVGSLADYLGFASVPSDCFPQTTSGTIDSGSAQLRKVNALPFRAYSLIYDFYYRNKTLEPSLNDSPYSFDFISDSDYELNDDGLLGPNTYINYPFMLKYRSWRRDSFTSSLPDPQKGNPVLLPESDLDLVSNGPLKFTKPTDFSSTDVASVAGGNLSIFHRTGNKEATLNSSVHADSSPSWTEGDPVTYKSGLKLSKSNSPTIEDLRYAEVLEEYEEALARSGAGNTGSFKEWLLSIWRTLSPDARLDRPEYLGGYRGPIQISEVPQTSSATETSPQGTLAGKGLSVGGNLLFKKHTFKEPGYLMVIMSVVPKSAYFQGDPRQFLYESCYDFPNPYFAHLGEQEVFAQELCASHAIFNSRQQKTFGYQVRNYEMKSIPDSIHGAFRDSLLYWHEGRVFDEYDPEVVNTGVNLNRNFIKMYPREVSRIFPSSESSDKLLGEFFFNFRVKRSLPYYGVPRFGHTK